MKQLLLVFIGGGAGSVLRYIIGKALNSSQTGIPYGTFAANILGSLLIGIILGLATKNETITQNHTLLLATGFCGGFTTFSTFAYENHIFLKSGDFASFALYTVASFIIGFLAVFAGIYLVNYFWTNAQSI
ncbi:fluoride efflux transporter CrcB [Tenacibaculum singaporense]|uniref:Fluoride-specific ion channel FluC n=1 Tax=Tenacibaculum singaporense TaxID=2358479 RepID=A0A3Q8RMP9_9FLAO|nr:fluoride efflux transporter CrcB [Tenacibaculum singaporense]AZJ35073.1 fluoride efflux transporter CrcB [Tenacibaculum singaporense]